MRAVAGSTLGQSAESAMAAFARSFRRFQEGHRVLRQRLAAIPPDAASLDGALERFRPFFVAGLDELAVCEERLNPSQRQRALELIAQSELAKWVLEAPVYRQVIEKPRGYAGDAEVMRLFYRGGYAGETAFGRLYHHLAVTLPEGRALRNRRKLLAASLAQLGRADRILSLACGPCAELFDADPEACAFEFVGLDHDPSTLDEVLAERPLLPNVRLGLANAFQLIAAPEAVTWVHPASERDPYTVPRPVVTPQMPAHSCEPLRPSSFSLVYSAGLFDYVPTDPRDDEKGAVGLTTKLFELVRPGGELMIGNFGPGITRGTHFYLNYVCDWNLIYRTPEELRGLARTLPSEQVSNVAVQAEPEGINLFLRIRKGNPA